MSGWSATLIAAGHILLPGSMSPVSLFEIWGLIQMISRSRSGWVTDISEPANVRPGCKVEGDAKADLSRAFRSESLRDLGIDPNDLTLSIRMGNRYQRTRQCEAWMQG